MAQIGYNALNLDLEDEGWNEVHNVCRVFRVLFQSHDGLQPVSEGPRGLE